MKNILFLIILLFTSCDKDEGNTDPPFPMAEDIKVSRVGTTRSVRITFKSYSIVIPEIAIGKDGVHKSRTTYSKTREFSHIFQNLSPGNYSFDLSLRDENDTRYVHHSNKMFIKI